LSVYQQLCYDSADIALGINVTKCGVTFKNTVALTTARNGLTASKTEYNALVTFTHSCGAQIRLYMAVHRYSSTVFGLCIMRSDAEGGSGIPSNWWTTI
jgi:hypothetical protein